VNGVKCKYCGLPSKGKSDLCGKHLELKWKYQEGHKVGYRGQETWND